jgi:deoxycytidylate deaminase
MVREYPELFFGLVGAIGTDLGIVEDALGDCLREVGYTPIGHRLSDLLRGIKKEPWSRIPARSSPEYYEKAIKAGDKFREVLSRNDALTALAIEAIRADRKNQDYPKRAYILHSLKRPEEVNLLRGIYGPAVIIIAVHSPRPVRVTRLAGILATSQHQNQSDAMRSRAEDLVVNDEEEAEIDFGQRVRKTFPLADFFIESSSPTAVRSSLQRFVELLFGNMWHTPSKDEQGMALAYLARVRSASPARQVGAAITDGLGNVLAIGTNEVARPGGGQYWEGDAHDGRDRNYSSVDMSDKMRRNLFGDLLKRMRDLGFLAENCPDVDQLLMSKGNQQANRKKGGQQAHHRLRSASLFDTIDYVRAVHAEAAALFALKSPVNDFRTTLYVTTFPCHECARHIVIAGIKRVIYIQPYPKSLVRELYQDSISIDDDNDGNLVSFSPFVGVAPTIYGPIFSLGQKVRKDDEGRIKKWTGSKSFPQLLESYSEQASRTAEKEMLKAFNAELAKKGFVDGSRPSDS